MSWSMIFKLPCSYLCHYGIVSSVSTGVHWKLGYAGNFNSHCYSLGDLDAATLTRFALWLKLIKDLIICFKVAIIPLSLNHCVSYCTYMWITRSISGQSSCCQYSCGSVCHLRALLWVQVAATWNLAVVWPCACSLESHKAYIKVLH